MNHRVNARLHNMPPCPECGAPAREPCTSDRGDVREPHNVRAKLAAGEIVIKQRAARLPLERAEVRSVRKGMLRAVDRAVDQVQRSWGINKARSRK